MRYVKVYDTNLEIVIIVDYIYCYLLVLNHAFDVQIELKLG